MRIGTLKFFEKEVITDTPGDPLMVRWILFSVSRGIHKFAIMVHKFYRSDHDRCLHDHPWNFLSIILKGGYGEVFESEGVETQAWRRPFSVLLRKAEWKHRVVLLPGHTCWSLVFATGPVRRWGFWPEGKWCFWRNYNPYKGICEDYEGR